MNEKNEVWLIAYDLTSENQKRMDKDLKKWVASKRALVWYHLRMTLKLRPIQQSLWMMRDDAKKDKVEEYITQTKTQYKAKGLEVLFEMFRISTNDAGMNTFDQWEYQFLMEWLGNLDKSLAKTTTLTSKGKYDASRKIELIEGIANEDFKGKEPFNLLTDMLMIVKDKLMGLVA